MEQLKAYRTSLKLAEGRILNAVVYRKPDVDEVIEYLEESHKKEVEQLLIEIVKLKNEIEVQKRLRDMALASVPNVLKVMKIIQHQKYKRCLAMAKWCDAMKFYFNESGFFDAYSNERMAFYERWRGCWLKIAEKFK